MLFIDHQLWAILDFSLCLPRRNSMASPCSPCSGTTSNSSMLPRSCPSYTIPSQSQALLLAYVVVGVITPFLFSFYDTVQGYSYQGGPRPGTETVRKKGARASLARNWPGFGRCLAGWCAAQPPTVTGLPSAFTLYPRTIDSGWPNQTC